MFEIVESGNLSEFRAELVRIKKSAQEEKKDPEQACINALSVSNGSGKGLLHIAAERGYVAVLEELLSYDLETDVKDASGRTPEQLALDAGKEKAAALLRTRGKWQKVARDSLGLRFNRAVRLLEDSFEPIQAGVNKEQVLFIGKTGAGKSTLINYLMGVTYKRSRKKAKKYAKAVAGNEVACVGHSMTSETLYPQTFSKSGVGFSYCDLAGFGENRGGEEGVCASCGPQMLTNVSKGIKGILLVMDFPSFESSRGAHFKEMMTLLGKIIRQQDQIVADNVYFVITKLPADLMDITAEDLVEDFVRPILGERSILSQIGDIFTGRGRQTLYNRLKQGDLSEEDIGRLYVLHLMSEDPSRILLPDIFDRGQSAQMLDAAIARNRLRNRRDYDFQSTDGAQGKFNSLLSKLADEFLSRKKKITIHLPEREQKLSDKQIGIEREIKDLRKEIEVRQREKSQSFNPAAIQAQIIAIEEKIQNSEAEIERLTLSKTNLRNEIKDNGGLESDLHEAEKPEKVTLWDEKFTPNWSKQGKGGVKFHSSGKTFSYSGLPFIEVEATSNKGGFSSTKSNNAAGTYSTKYDCHRHTDAQANVKIHTTRNLMPEWQDKIKNIKQKIARKEKEMNDIDIEIPFIKARISSFREEISQRQQEIIKGELAIESRNARLDNEIERRESRIRFLNRNHRSLVDELKSVSQLIVDTKLEIEVNVKLFITLYHILQVMSFESGAFGEFMTAFVGHMSAERLTIPELGEAIGVNPSDEMPRDPSSARAIA